MTRATLTGLPVPLTPMLTLFLAKVLGSYYVIAGAAVLADKRHFMLAIAALSKERYAQLLSGILALGIGLTIVNLNIGFQTLPACIISLGGYLALIKGIAFMLIPERYMERFVHAAMNRKWFLIEGIGIMGLGLYLAGYGYGLW